MNSARKTKLRIKHHKPRNPLVAPVMQLKAGSHRKPHKALRHTVKAAFRKMDLQPD